MIIVITPVIARGEPAPSAGPADQGEAFSGRAAVASAAAVGSPLADPPLAPGAGLLGHRT